MKGLSLVHYHVSAVESFQPVTLLKGTSAWAHSHCFTLYFSPGFELEGFVWKVTLCCFARRVVFQCPPDESAKSRRAAENDLVDNAFNQVPTDSH